MKVTVEARHFNVKKALQRPLAVDLIGHFADSDDSSASAVETLPNHMNKRYDPGARYRPIICHLQIIQIISFTDQTIHQ